MSLHTLSPQEIVLAGARHDFGTFLELVFATINPGVTLARAWYISAMVHELNQIADGSNRRLQITVPPRHLKSITTTVAFTAWMMGRDPSYRIICVSYGKDLSTALSRDFRKVVGSAWYAVVFPEMASSITQNTGNEVNTRQGGFRYAAGLDGAVTGYGADLIIIDDLMKAQDASYPEARAKAHRFVDETLSSRLNDKGKGCVVAIAQRLAEDDVPAHLNAKGGYRHLNLPAIAMTDDTIPLTRGRLHHRKINDVLNPQRESREILEQLRRDMGSRAFETQYQQNPIPADGDIIRWDRIQFYDEDPAEYRLDENRHKLTQVVISWDTADTDTPKSDYSVGTVCGYDGALWRVLDVIRVRLSFSDLLARVRLERNRWKADIVIVEAAGIGRAILNALSQDMRCQSEPRHHAPWCVRRKGSPKLGKAERFIAASEPLYAGTARLPRNAPWLEDLRREMMAFPNGRHDDQVDSLSQFLGWMVSNGGLRAVHNQDRFGRAA